MKKAYIFCTKWWLYLTEIPPILILTLCIIYNNKVDTPQKLYPLIAFCSLVIIFIFLYFFRIIVISTEEIRTVGLFSSKDSAIIEKDRILVFTLLQKNKMKIELEGKTSAPGFSWIKGGEYEECYINIYRERAVGGKIAVSRVLNAIGVNHQEVSNFFEAKSLEKKYENITVTSYVNNEDRIIKIYFAKTI